MAQHWRSPFTQLEMREMWTYGDGALTAKAYWRPGWTAVASRRGRIRRWAGHQLGAASLADAGRLDAAQRATADQRASFQAFVAQHDQA